MACWSTPSLHVWCCHEGYSTFFECNRPFTWLFNWLHWRYCLILQTKAHTRPTPLLPSPHSESNRLILTVASPYVSWVFDNMSMLEEGAGWTLYTISRIEGRRFGRGKASWAVQKNVMESMYQACMKIMRQRRVVAFMKRLNTIRYLGAQSMYSCFQQIINVDIRRAHVIVHFRSCPAPITPPPCTPLASVLTQCGFLKNPLDGVFSRCIMAHGEAIAAELFEDCLIDACNTNGSSVCLTLQVVVDECNELGFPIGCSDWLNETGCGQWYALWDTPSVHNYTTLLKQTTF